jgi:hypothetical protein
LASGPSKVRVPSGHDDLNDAPRFPRLHVVVELTSTCTTIIWITSTLHAAINFGQYPYAGTSRTGQR